MFSRIVGSKSLYKISKHILVTQHHGVFTRYSPIIQTQRALHVKIYDKDAGLDTKRLANKLVSNDDLQENHDIGESQSHHLRRRKRSVVSSQTNPAETASNTNEVAEPVALEQSSKTKDVFTDNNDADVFGNAPREPIKEDEGKLLFLTIAFQ